MAISYFQARDYLQEALYDSGGRANPAARTVLLFLLSNAIYRDDQNYGQVIEAWCAQEDIAAVTGYSLSTVWRALGELERIKWITRSRGGRKNHRPDRISVLPLLEKAEKSLAEKS